MSVSPVRLFTRQLLRSAFSSEYTCYSDTSYMEAMFNYNTSHMDTFHMEAGPTRFSIAPSYRLFFDHR